MSSDDERWMWRALALAERGRYTVSPNPLVGCVIVRDGIVAGEGWHSRRGGPHAEIVALGEAGTEAKGSCAYVTLEPCAHTGLTGPCVQALLDAEVSRVVVGVADPWPVAAGGAALLRASGVEVAMGVLQAEARRQNEVFFHTVATGRPFVVLKLATSLDGRIAAADGTSRWLTGEKARERAHVLRAEVDAVVVGSGTVLADDPRLTVRLAGYEGPQPLRVVLDRRGRVPAHARVHDALILHEPGPAEVLARLWERGVRSVLVEGGAQVAGAFLAAGLVDKVVAHIAGLLLGAGGVPALTGEGIHTLAAAPRLRIDRVEKAGSDVILTLYPTRSPSKTGEP
ncbi:MAG: bifunctional diaminohydroxyphosphoribosylaminopyrimidine deaminase/5-amino-6-(5-phosphoribosylamino)uracil reductase RibD [Egibacteraceae bacterium]